MLFVCESCQTIENTALPTHYLATVAARVQVASGAASEAVARRASRDLACSACEPRGKWHNRFHRRKYDAERDGPIGYMRQLRGHRHVQPDEVAGALQGDKR